MRFLFVSYLAYLCLIYMCICSWLLVLQSYSYLYTLVAARVAERKVYVIMHHSVEVALFSGADEEITGDDSIPLVISDNILILGNVPSSMSDGILKLYIDNITELDGEQNDYSLDRNNDEVVITFNAALDVHKFPTGM